MKSKRLLLTLLLALFVPWAAMAQTLTIYDGEPQTTNRYVPIDGYNVDGTSIKSECVIPASQLTAMNGKEITQMTYYLSTVGNRSWGNATFKVFLKEVEFTTISSLQGLTGATVVYDTKGLDCTQSTMDVVFDNPYTYNGGNLLVGVYIVAKGTYTGSYNDYKPLYAGQTVTGASYHSSTGQQNFIPKTTFTYQAPPCCPKPKDLACTATTGTPATATFTWTNGDEETQWQLEYGTTSDFSGASTVTINQSNLVNDAYTLNGLTAEQTYYAHIRAYCPSCDPNYSDWSNTIDFKPTNAISQTVCDGTTTNSYVPVYGNYAENYNKDEFIIPATTEGMAGMAGGTISKMTFYLSTPASDLWGAALYRVFMKEVNESSFASTSYYGTDGATIVYEGALDGTQSTMTIEFTTDYEYNGGNLLVGIYEYNKGSYKSCYFYGITSNNGALYKNSSTSLESITSGTLQNFIPKTTFTYLPCTTPKPKNLHVVDGSLWSGGATLAWEAPSSATPTSYEYCYKTDASAWSAWESTPELSVALNLSSSTHYTFEVKAIYDGVGESAAIQTDFTTLDDCAFPTNLVATTTPGQGTKATLTWVKGYDEEAWVLQYGTDANFTDGTYTEKTSGFIPQTEPGLENVVAAVLTGLTAETKYYARVKADCGGGSTSTWSNVATFTPSNYVDYTINNNNTTTTYYVPFYCYYIQYGTNGQFIIPATMLTDVAGGTIRRLTFYSTTASKTWEGATFKVYMKEVENTAFATTPTEFDWDMTEVYSGILSIADNQMVIEFGNDFNYGNGNLMIGFQETANGGTNSYLSWRVVSGFTNAAAYGYMSSATATNMTYSRSSYLPMMTFNYQPTPYQKIAAINEGTITSNTAELTWTAPETTATIVGYYYQYKMTSTAEWPTGWHNLDANTTSVTLGELTPGTSYDFRIKVLYEGNHESAVTSTSFFTECAIVTAFPWKEDFEAYAAGDFSHPCWVNEHISGDGTNIFKVYTSANGSNTTHQLQLPDQTAGTETMLRLPEMNLPSNSYQFVIDVYRNTNTFQQNPYELEGVYVYVSTDGNIEGATELAYIPRHRQVSNAVIPAEEENGWYTYELPIGISGNCYIILKGVNQYCTSIYMDNFSVEEIPSCARPTDLAKSEVTNHSATLTWTAGDPDQHNWQVAYSKTSFDPNTANFDLTTVETVDFTTGATCTYRMDKLFDAESTYYLYIRANCGTATEPDYGPWSRKGINLTTLGASPAPSNFTASNIGSQTADLVWTAGGGDYELSWDLYYVQSDDAPTAPTEETHATKTVTTLPTTENPYTLDGLREESRYYIWVRANHTINSVTTHSAWVALTGNYFNTLAACPTPTGLAYNNLTAVSADLTWVGSPDVTDYTVQYRTAAGMGTTVLSEGFGSSIPTDWENKTGLLSDVMAGTTSLSSTSTQWYFGTSNGVFDNHARINIYGSGSSERKGWLITKAIDVTDGTVLSFDLALTAYTGNNVPAPATSGTDDRFVVLVTTDNEATWESLREWNNSGSAYVYNNIANTATGENVVLDLSNYKGNSVKIAFYGESTTSNADNNLHIDNVIVGTPTPAGAWIDATTNVEEQSFQLTGLTAGTKYDVQVKSNCTSGEYCEPISFTTLAEGNMVFTNATNDGKWGNSGNWAPAQLPVLTDEVILRANATIESGCVAQAKQITFQGSPTPTLTIENGGQLQHDNTSTITATVKKTIAGYGEENFETNNGYVLFAPPFDKYIYNNNSDGTGLRNGTYDLYSWSRTARPEWTNYGANNTSYLSMSRGTGYLYANQATTEVTFTGSIYGSGSKYSKYVYYTEPTANRFQDWNLIGNPFVCNAYLATETGTPLAYYKMNAAGNGFEAVTGAAIAPMEGVFYQATEAGYVYFFRELPAGNIMPGNLNINLTQAVTTRGEQGATDNAIIRFGEGNTLGKFSFREGSSKVYIPMEGKDYAVVNAEGKTGEIPVNFKAEKNGSYTLSFTSQEVSFSYLHLIDNLTGNDVDLLANPSYSFDAQTTDYAQRFRLVFATGSSVDGDSFAFINGMGNLSIFGIEGTATVQVMDVLGHVLSSETFSGSYEKQLNVAPGVYMIRLINGNDVKVQKMIVK